MLAVTASHDSGGEGVSGSGPLLCLWDENSSRSWMVCSSAIEKIKLIVVKMVLNNGKEGESSPALAVPASLESVREGIGGSGSLLCL